MAKKAPDQIVTGESGVHLIARIVDEMRHIWHPAIGPDSGIDGQIELRDPSTGDVRNVRLGVQSKATTGKWDRETDKAFTYRPAPNDIAYWLSSNQPVLLICSRPGEAYWRSVQEWARDPKARAKGYLRFDKVQDRFDASAAARLFDLKAASTDWVEPPGPPRVAEKLLTNLMPIAWRTDHVTRDPDTSTQYLTNSVSQKEEEPMRDIATATVSGNLTRDLELKALPSGTDVARLRVATTTRRRAGEEWVDKTNYFTVEVYGAQARSCAQYLRKGSRVLVDAELEWREWTDQQGNKREAVTLRARQVVFEGGRPASTAGEDAAEQNGAAPDGAGQPGPEPAGVTGGGSETSASADDLPF
jgi:single-strand DNA-binding protein